MLVSNNTVKETVSTSTMRKSNMGRPKAAWGRGWGNENSHKIMGCASY